MEKFQDFSVIQILREINFGESRSPKTAVFVIFGALNFVDYEFLHFLIPPKTVKTAILELLDWPKLISWKI